MTLQDLFMFYLGGSVAGANIEVHDVQFAVGETPEGTFPGLAARWFGDPSSIHVDTITRVRWVDGHDVMLRPEPSSGPAKLWFINMGGYRPGVVQELHAIDLIVADTADEAKGRAKATLLTGVILQHKDNQVDVDDCIRLSEFNGLHVHLVPNPNGTRDGQPEFQGFKLIGPRSTTA